MGTWSFVLSVISSIAFLQAQAIGTEKTEEKTAGEFVVRSIAHVKKVDGRTVIVFDRKYEPGLLGLDGFSQGQIIWWFDKNDKPRKWSRLQVHCRGNQKNPLTGVFATRVPVPHSLLGLTLCKIVSVKDNVIDVKRIHAFEGSSLLGLNSHAPGQESVQEAKVSAWAKPK